MKTLRALFALFCITLITTACTLTVSTDYNENDEPYTEEEEKMEQEDESQDVDEGGSMEDEPDQDSPPAQPSQDEPEDTGEGSSNTVEDTGGDGADTADEGVSDEPEPEPEAVLDPVTIEVTVDNWVFSPNVITVQQGQDVTLKLIGSSGAHGFSVPGLGINELISEGETVTVALPTDTAGTYNLLCSVACGSGHDDMTGSIIIE